MNRLQNAIKGALGMLAAGVCLTVARAGPAAVKNAPPVKGDNGAHSIVLPIMQTELPPGPKAGRDVASTSCAFCHSSRYILNQPSFPRQTWVNEVQKMRTTFGAPIAEQQIPDIVDYLMSIRGRPEPTSQP